MTDRSHSRRFNFLTRRPLEQLNSCMLPLAVRWEGTTAEELIFWLPSQQDKHDDELDGDTSDEEGDEENTADSLLEEVAAFSEQMILIVVMPEVNDIGDDSTTEIRWEFAVPSRRDKVEAFAGDVFKCERCWVGSSCDWMKLSAVKIPLSSRDLRMEQNYLWVSLY